MSSTPKKPVDHEVSGTIEKVTVITRRVNGVTKHSNQVIIKTVTGERVTMYCSDLILESALASARYEVTNGNLRALSRKGNAVTVGYDFNAKGSKYIDGNGKEQVRNDDSNSLRYMNIDDLLLEHRDAEFGKAEKTQVEKALELKMLAKNASPLSVLRSSSVITPEAEPETENIVNDEAVAVLAQGKGK